MKNTIFWLVLLTALITSSCVPAAPAPPDLSIWIVNWSIPYSEGGTQVLELTIDHNGNVGFASLNMPTPPDTVRVTRLTTQQVQELATAIEQADIWNMESIPVPAGLSWTVVQITLNGRYKMITHPGGAACSRDHLTTTAFCQLEEKIWAYSPVP